VTPRYLKSCTTSTYESFIRSGWERVGGLLCLLNTIALVLAMANSRPISVAQVCAMSSSFCISILAVSRFAATIINAPSSAYAIASTGCSSNMSRNESITKFQTVGESTRPWPVPLTSLKYLRLPFTGQKREFR
jgi:hypothetical protein